MSRAPLTILNIGLDSDLLSRGVPTETQARQLLYARHLPARLVHIVKAPRESLHTRIDLDANLSVLPCPVRHWSQFICAAIGLGGELLHRERFDLIQVQEPFVSGLAGVRLARRFRLPLVVGLYSDEIDNPVWLAERSLNRLANHLGKWVLCQAAAARSDSLAVAQRLSHYGFRHLTYIPFLITHADKVLNPDARAEDRRRSLLDGLAGPLLLAVCRLEQEKNIPLMLSAFAIACRQHTGLVLAIAGRGSLADALAQEAERIVPGRVRWLGWVGSDDIPAYYQAADLTLLSSNRESAARVLYESLLAGTPVLTTDTAGACEVIDDGVTGRIVPVGDLDAYSHALVELSDAPDRLAEMGREGRRRMSEHVTTEAVIQQLRQLYEKALGRTA